VNNQPLVKSDYTINSVKVSQRLAFVVMLDLDLTSLQLKLFSCSLIHVWLPL